MNMINGCYTEDGAPLKCPFCGCTDHKEVVRDFIDVLDGSGPATEVEYICMYCGKSIAYWAHGHFDPSYMQQR